MRVTPVSEPVTVREIAAARAFYCDVLRGRQVWRTGRAGAGASLWFVVAGSIVEVGSNVSSTPPVVLHVDDPDGLAERCWDAGFSVQVHQDATGQTLVSVVDPFGRRIDLAPRVTARTPCLTAFEEQR
jgi:catechol 2,3-dioxygenase-like lactoylglutathione lyase family enzyme